jgi:hypothetical protein
MICHQVIGEKRPSTEQFRNDKVDLSPWGISDSQQGNRQKLSPFSAGFMAKFGQGLLDCLLVLSTLPEDQCLKDESK